MESNPEYKRKLKALKEPDDHRPAQLRDVHHSRGLLRITRLEAAIGRADLELTITVGETSSISTPASLRLPNIIWTVHGDQINPRLVLKDSELSLLEDGETNSYNLSPRDELLAKCCLSMWNSSFEVTLSRLPDFEPDVQIRLIQALTMLAGMEQEKLSNT